MVDSPFSSVIFFSTVQIHKLHITYRESRFPRFITFLLLSFTILNLISSENFLYKLEHTVDENIKMRNNFVAL